jgi:regulator of replication initiation timing
MKSWIIIGVLTSILLGGWYYYYTTSQKRIASLIENNARLEANIQIANAANEQNIQTINNLLSEYDRIQENFNRLQSEFQIIRSQNAELRERLSRHELDVLAAARPALIERRINNASANVLRCFELMSGAPLNERERAATTEREFNSECPWLFQELKR